MEQVVLLAGPEQAGERIDRFVSEQGNLGLSRSMVQKLCGNGHLLADGNPVNKNYKLRGGEQVCVQLPEPRDMDTLPQDIPLDILFEDQDLLVVNKPKGMVVHPAAGNPEGTLVNALLHHCQGSLSGIGGIARPGIVHRIDKDTSGLLVVAKTDFAHIHLSEAVKEHSFTRIYQAVVYGVVKEDKGKVDAPIGRHPHQRKKMCVLAGGREAVTHFQVLRRYREFTHLQLRLETGRTHQIRVHMKHIGHPVAGDPVYGPKKVIASLEGQCLHAGTLGFVHPRRGEYLEFESPPPPSFARFLERLERQG